MPDADGYDLLIPFPNHIHNLAKLGGKAACIFGDGIRGGADSQQQNDLLDQLHHGIFFVIAC